MNKFRTIRFMTGWALQHKKGFFSRWKNVCYGDYYPTFPEQMRGKVIVFESKRKALNFVLDKLMLGPNLPQKSSEPESPHIVGSTYLPN